MKSLKLRDGIEIDVKTGKIKQEAESRHTVPILNDFDPIPKQGMKLEDLPADHTKMSVICAVAGYRLLGIPDADIAMALNCRVADIDIVTRSDAFEKSWNAMREAFVQGQRNNAKDVLAHASITAANQVANVMRSSKNEANVLRAAEAILNRTGVGSDNENSMGGGGLLIRIVKDAEHTDIKIGVN